MMVQLIRDRLLQKNKQSSQNNSNSAIAVDTSKSSNGGAGNTSQSNQNDASMTNKSKSGRSGRMQNMNIEYGQEEVDERQMQLLEELKYNIGTNESTYDNIQFDEESSLFNPQYQQQVLQQNNTTANSNETRRTSAAIAVSGDTTPPQLQILMNGATGTTDESNFSQQLAVQQMN